MTVLITNARIVDVRAGEIREGQVSIRDGAIASLEPGRVDADRVVDLEGGYLLPGLITCHTHFSLAFPFNEVDPDESPAITALRCQKRARETLALGITTVRTVGELHRADIALRTMIQKGWAEGPRILSAGRSVSTTGGHGAGFSSVEADGADAFLRAARQELAAGANHIKIFITGGIAHREESFGEPQTTPEEMRAAVAAARSKDTYVCAHAGAPGPIVKAVEAGVHCFEHGYTLDRDAARTMRAAGAYLVPTLGVTRSESFMKANRFEPWTIAKALEAGPAHLDAIRIAVKEGVRIVNGTDLPPGDPSDGTNATVREMEHLVDAGLSPLESIRASTLRAAELLGIARHVGAVDAGYAADLVAVRANPLTDIAAMRGIFLVMQAGRTIRWDRP